MNSGPASLTDAGLAKSTTGHAGRRQGRESSPCTSPWQGRTWALTPPGLMRTAEEDQDVHVLDVAVSLYLGI
jgi:hypothetical protein